MADTDVHGLSYTVSAILFLSFLTLTRKRFHLSQSSLDVAIRDSFTVAQHTPYPCATYTLPLRNSKVAVAQEQLCCCAAANNFNCYQHESGPTACHESEKYRLLYLRRLVMACRWQILHDTTDRTLCPPQTNWKSINNRPSTEGAEGFSFPLPLLTNKKKQLLIKKTRKHFAVSKKRRTFASQLRNRCTLSSVGRAIDS